MTEPKPVVIEFHGGDDVFTSWLRDATRGYAARTRRTITLTPPSDAVTLERAAVILGGRLRPGLLRRITVNVLRQAADEMRRR